MKKIGIILAICCCMGMLSGCGNQEQANSLLDSALSQSESAESELTENEADSEEKTTVQTEEITEAAVKPETEAVTEAETKPASETNAESTVKDIVLYESANVRITYTGEDESFLGPELQLKIENLSTQSLTVQTRDVSVNGVMIEPLMSVDITPGKAAIDGMSFMSSDLEANNITEIGTVELRFHIYNSDTWDTIEDTEMITLTLRETKSAERAQGLVVYDTNGLRITYTGLKQDDIWGMSAWFDIQNDTGYDITVQTRDVSVDGIMCDPLFSEDIANGKYSNCDMIFMDEPALDHAASMELSFHVYETSTFDTIVDTELITIDLTAVQ